MKKGLLRRLYYNEQIRVWYVVITFLLLLLTLGAVLYWVTEPHTPPLVINSFTLDSDIVEAGESLRYTIDYCKYTNRPGIISKSLVNGVVIDYSPIITNANKGCFKGSGSIRIEPFISPGKWSIKWTASYQLNIFKLWSLTEISDQFEVTNKRLSLPSD